MAGSFDKLECGVIIFSAAVVCNSYSNKMTIKTKKKTSDNGLKPCCSVGFLCSYFKD